MSDVQKRKHIRFKPDKMAYASVDFSSGSKDSFDPETVAIIVEEAPMGGCGLVVCTQKEVKVDDSYIFKVGELSPLLGTVRWVKKLDEEIYKIGIEFLE